MSHDLEEQFLDGYDRYADALYRFIYLRVGRNRELAEDLLQQTFCNVWKAMRKKGSLEHLQAFLYTTARNVTIDHFKRASTRREIVLDDFDAADDGSVIDEIDAVLDTERLVQIIEHLPEKLLNVVQLRFVEDMSISETANALTISKNAVSVRINRALSYLRKIYEQLETTKR